MKPARFAELIRVSPSAVSMWLSGDRVPDRDSAVLIEGATEGEVPVRAWGRAKRRAPRVRPG
jgi:DNA-binding transcriptional regulator YdaS (Cro superfamily)